MAYNPVLPLRNPMDAVKMIYDTISQGRQDVTKAREVELGFQQLGESKRQFDAKLGMEQQKLALETRAQGAAEADISHDNALEDRKQAEAEINKAQERRYNEILMVGATQQNQKTQYELDKAKIGVMNYGAANTMWGEGWNTPTPAGTTVSNTPATASSTSPVNTPAKAPAPSENIKFVNLPQGTRLESQMSGDSYIRKGNRVVYASNPNQVYERRKAIKTTITKTTVPAKK